MTQYFEDFKTKLQEMFMTDTDLDFGIYRIMKAKRAEIEKFIDTDLKKTVDEALSQRGKGDKQEIKKQMKEIELRMGNVDLHTLPEAIPDVKKYLELEKQLGNSVDVASLEDDVYSRLTDFFSRYYDNGDFVSNRRYTSDGSSYVIPYDGEEVKLHWANSDQYYIKTSENFQNYRFNVGGYAVRLELVNATTEQNNNKSTDDKKRVFMLYSEVKKKEDGVSEDTPDVETFELEELTEAQEGMPHKEFIVRFVYDIPSVMKETVIDPKTGKEKEQDIDWTQRAYDAIMAYLKDNDKNLMYELIATYKTSKKDVLRHHLDSYVGKNSFDYFIHKDLGRFLRFELDYYIKNEVLLLQDLDIDTVSTHLNVAKAIKTIGEKVITLLAQIEDFQKKLWLKKKFVLQSNYCITLDRVPTSFYSEIVANEQQRKEWVRLFAINEIKGDLMHDGYSEPLTVKFLEDNQFLVLDTAFFSPSFKHRLETAIKDVDKSINGLLINSENFQALELLQEKYAESVKCSYFDPPYNTDASSILYKNNYKNSSFLSLIQDRVFCAKKLLSNDGIISAAIDDAEFPYLKLLLQNVFEKELGVTVVRSNPQSRKAKGKLSPSHEYGIFLAKSDSSMPCSLGSNIEKYKRYPLVDEKGHYSWMNFIRAGNNDLRSDRPKLYYPIAVNTKDHIRILDMIWNDSSNEYDLLEKPRKDEILVYPIKTERGTLIEKNWQRGHLRVKEELLSGEYRVRRVNGSISIDFKTRMDEEAIPNTWWDKSEYASSNYGSAEQKAIFGEKVFDFPKALSIVYDSLKVSGAYGDCIALDFFAGSGTTGHAAIQLNREGNNIKYILCEMGQYFDSVTKIRNEKVIYSSDWKDGVPISRKGISQCFKYLRLEQYEDTLNNLSLVQPTSAGLFIDKDFSDFSEGYLLHYMLDTETRGSLFSLEWFTNPFNMHLMTSEDNELVDTQVDLVETFNYLIGLEVESISWNEDESICAVVGKKHIGSDKVLVLWRNCTMVDNDQLNAYFAANCKDIEGLDTIYANGNSTLGTIKAKSDHWTVELTEAEFMNKMFNIEEAD